MSSHEINLLLEGVFLISSILAAPLIAKIAFTITMPIWTRLFQKRYLKLTFKDGDKTYSVVVDPKTDYALDLEKRLQSLGFGHGTREN
ncbi:hypothetical protein AWH61_19065 [Alteromonas sp. W12]|jgi:hypothetical protein|uniref:hypothetical protein n=1 Tax=Alteromonas sp. W12 TaxID=1772289 RepID=UPI000948ECDF|nr:hypothetical protein [Alteromonas sp. W12]OLF71152.1 hypothetical protein AWH61_19065 [Alteromonas sp. W12]